MHQSVTLLLLLLIHVYCKGDQISEGQQRGLDFMMQVCTGQENCQPEPVGLVMDYSYFCKDPTTCNVVSAE